MKKPLIILGSLFAVAVIILVALPFLVDADHFRPQVESQLQAALGRKVSIGKLSLSLLAGGVSAENISIDDDPAYSSAPFLKAESVDIGVDLVPLILSKSMNVRSITVNKPVVNLIRGANGQWNYSSLANAGSSTQAAPVRAHKGRQKHAEPPAAPAVSAATPSISVGSLRLKDGTINLGRVGERKQRSYTDVDLKAEDISLTSRVPFKLDATTPGGGKLHAEGNAGPVARQDAAETPLTAQVKISGMDVASSGFVDPSSGISGVLDFDGSVKSDGKIATSSGKATLAKAKLVKNGAPARVPVTVDYAAEYTPEQQEGQLTKGDIHFGNSAAHLTGNFDTRGASPALRMKLAGNALPVDDVEGLLPALGVILPAGASLRGGTANANLGIQGPLDALVTAGTVDLQNAHLTGFDLAKKMSALSALAGIKGGNDTNIQLMSSNLRIAPEGIRTDNLNLVVANLGSITGAGSIANNNALDFHMTAKLSNANNLIGGMSQIASLGQSRGAIPFLIQGTTQNPIFVPDVGRAMVGTAAAPAQGVGKILGGLFGKKH